MAGVPCDMRTTFPSPTECVDSSAAAAFLLRQEPQEDDEEEEDDDKGNRNEGQDDDETEHDGYSERPERYVCAAKLPSSFPGIDWAGGNQPPAMGKRRTKTITKP